MHEVEKGLNEVCGMLKIIESDIKKCAWYSHLMVVQNKPSLKKRVLLGKRRKPRLKRARPLW
jgi:hypothetical protein